MSPAVRLVKRALDVTGASIGLGLTLPLYPAVALAIRLESPGKVLFRQKRAGEFLGHEPGAPHKLRFKTFEMLKFRTMRADAEAKTGAVLASKNDARVTTVGRLLRRTRLDEAPQFWNVLLGHMSLVGPRPERPELAADLALAIPYFEERSRGVKPGLTGLAQVSLGYTGRPFAGNAVIKHLDSLTNPFDVEGAEGALADDMRIKLLYDLAYCVSLERFSTFLRSDLGIILRTPFVMIRALGF